MREGATPGDRLVLTLLHAPDHEAKAAAAAALYRHNVESTGIADRTPIGAKLSDPRSGEVLGGLWGRTELGLLFLDMLFLAQHMRGHAYGSRLLLAVENEARRRGCKRAVVETSSFQAAFTSITVMMSLVVSNSPSEAMYVFFCARASNYSNPPAVETVATGHPRLISLAGGTGRRCRDGKRGDGSIGAMICATPSHCATCH
jgi:GNAT superfamily N-acetyltransferase